MSYVYMEVLDLFTFSHCYTVKEELKLDKVKNAKSSTTQRRNQRLYLPLSDGNGQTARPSNIIIIILLSIKSRFEPEIPGRQAGDIIHTSCGRNFCTTVSYYYVLSS